ncbi:LysR substrate-binding domain-containing protein [Halomonas sp. PGE1]|uniref:LysR substrate-binding domain-containing protein n=1 Tax=Halomonas sp. PGE1 TaxID=2730360 RepID=UPI0014760E02|nr:LysR substrate-binding domain-containing protein [Halomonas sp. PGE1]QJQ97909.1 LysR family transcriptional regulator [Halomonas sp. PGE1]
MKDHQLKALVQVAEQGSIRGAARALHLSQSALTKALRELEADLGAELLVRSFKGVEFTPAGQALLSRARLALATLDKARDEIRWLRGGAGTQVTAGVTPAIAATVLPGVLKAFQQEQPEASLTLVEGMLTNVLPGLMEGRIDFAIAAAEPEGLPYEIAFEPLARLRVEPAARVGHPLLGATSWSQLADARWVLNLATGSMAHQLVSWLDRQRIQLSHPVVKCDSPALMTEMMRRTDLIGFGPRILFQDPLFGQGLACFESLPPVPLNTLGLLRLKGVPLNSGAQRLVTLFHRYIAALPPQG